MHDDHDAPGARPERRRGNRALLTFGLAMAATAVACLAVLQSAAGAAQTPAVTSPVADTQAAQAQQAAAAQSDAADYTIEIKNYAFSQPKLTVKVGDTVKWTNEDTAPHTVTTTSGPAKFDSGNLSKGQSFSYTFTKAGTYQYYCAVHPDMTAEITVVDDSSGSGGTGSGGTSTGGTTTGGTSGGDTSGGTTTGGSSGGSSGGDMGGMTGGSTSGSTSGGTSGGGGSEECHSIQQSLLPILQHINSAHLEQSPGEQVQAALDLDNYIKLHTVWIESIINPAVNGGSATADQTLTVILQHINSAHLEESLGQQVSDILDPDAYVKTHTVWAEHLLAPTENYLTTSC